ncbi:PDZ domain-containing protein [Neorhodopirellula pilleata]|uniref:Serine endoprotease n=1 Tax=Neorhodopirellula pilleata TaxID=2714738 RepID=A0A5C6AII9_9BACT|nr:PDZ domain-containing protein [Neorhodopirellula pilleata]TWT99058.1 serine endoprotease [Neorhodopirellula pilleata]
MLFCPAIVSSHSAGRAGVLVKTIGLLLGFVVFASLVDSSTASAQGLFGRMRARIEARRLPTPPVPSPANPNPANPNAVNPNVGNSPRVLATPMAGGLQPADASGAEALPGSPTFGIDVTPARVGPYQGLRVLGFQPDSRANAAGLQPGDVIVSIEGQPTRSLADVGRSLAASTIGRQAEIQVIRNGRLYRTTVPVINGAAADGESNEPSDRSADSIAKGTSRPDTSSRSAAKPPVSPATGPTLARPRSSLGLEVRNATPQRGIEVVVAPEGTAGVIGGLKPQDRIVSVDGRLVKDIDGLIRELSVTQPGESVRFGVVRGESMLELDIEMGGPRGKPIRGATEQNAPSTAANQDAGNQSDAAQGDVGSSILGGMGAALGGLFAPKEPSKNSSANPPATKPNPATDKPAQVAAESVDPLALPEDDAPQRQGSADLLPPPQAEVDPAMSEVERLRAEVERLKRQLNQK